MPTPHGGRASSGGASSDAPSEARLLAELLDASTEMACAIDGDGRLAYVNRAWERTLGYSRAEAASLVAVALVAPAHRDAYHAAARRLVAGETLEAFETVLTTRDGRLVTCRGRVTPVMAPDPAGGAPRCLGARALLRDVGAERPDDAAHELALLVGAMQDVVMVLDRRGTYRRVLDTAPSLLYRSADQLVGRRVTDFFAPAMSARFLAAIACALDERRPVTLDYALPLDGREVHFTATASPLDDEQVLFVARDVTAQKEAELELRLLLRVSHALAEATDVLEAGALTLAATCDAAGWEYGEMWLVDEHVAGGGAVLKPGPVWHLPGDEPLAAFAAESARAVVAYDRCLPGRAWAAGAVVRAPDLRAPDVAFQRLDAARHARLIGGAAVPVLAHGRVVAVLAFQTRDARRARHADVDLLTAVAAHVGTVVQRKQAESALAQERVFLSTVLDSLSENVSVCAPDGQLVLFNRATREVHGLPENPDLAPEEWSAYYGVLLPDGVTTFPTERLPHVRALATRADVDDVEYLVAVPGRPHRTMVANARVLHGPDGEFLGSVCAARDMTAQKAAEAALRASEERHRALFERSTAIQWVVDPESGCIVDANESAARFYGYPLAAMRGKPLGEISLLPASALRALHAREGDGTGGVVPHRLASGEVRMVEFHPTRVTLDGRTFTHSVLHDVTDRIRVETALRQSESRLSLIYDSATDLMFLMAVERDGDGRVADFRCESVNAAYLELSGVTADQIVGRTLREVMMADDVAGAVARYAEAVTTGDVLRFEEELELAAGRLTVETTLTPVFDGDGACTHVLGSARDVTARLRAEAALRESEARFRGVLETVRAVAVTLDGEGRVTFANDALLALTGWSRDEVVGHDWFRRFVPEPAEVRRVFASMLKGAAAVPHYESEILTRQGDRRLIAWDNTLLHDATGAVSGTASIGRDITAQRALEARLAALSEHDELTGLLNRRGFRRMAEHELKVGRRAGRRGSVLYLDMDGFKQINDEHGHAEGDQALRAVADVLRHTIREGDLAARLGGDEFVVYATGAATADEGEALAARLRQQLSRANEAAMADGRPYTLRFSVGVAATEGGDDLDAVLTRADAALYARKLSRRAGAGGR